MGRVSDPRRRLCKSTGTTPRWSSSTPQNEVLSEKGAAWAAVRESVTEHKTVENIERICQAGEQHGFEVFISPH